MKELIRGIACSICEALTKDTPEYIPDKSMELTGNQVDNIIRLRFPEGKVYISDSKNYYACSYDDIAYFLAQDQTNRQDYVSEKYDCDDFANRLYGQFSVPNWSDLCLGKMWTDKHALNVMITQDKKLVFLEPQSDTISDDLADWQGTTNRFIEI